MAQDPEQARPDPELQRLAPLLGTWRVEGRTEESIAGPVGVVTSEETFYWLDGGYFLVSTYRTVFGNDPPQTGINYWGYDSSKRRFQIIFFSNNGPFTEAGNRYEGVVSGGTLTFTRPARFTLELDSDGKVKVNPDGTITLVWDIRAENGQWQHWMGQRIYTDLVEQDPGHDLQFPSRTDLILAHQDEQCEQPLFAPL